MTTPSTTMARVSGVDALTANVTPATVNKGPIEALFTGPLAQKYIAKFLPEGVNLERVAASVLLAVKNDKGGKLKLCTPESLLLGVARIQQWGLELGVTAYLLPFQNKIGDEKVWEATPTASYVGLAELIIGSGAVKYIDTKAVYEGDYFDYQFGTGAFLKHKPGPKAKRGPITHAWVKFVLPGGNEVFDVMAIEDIDELRKRYSKQWKDGACPAWYAKKTIVRQSTKLFPKNPKYASMLAKIAAVFGDDQHVEAIAGEPGAVASLRGGLMDDDDETRMIAANDEFQDDRDLDDDPRDDRGHQPPY